MWRRCGGVSRGGAAGCGARRHPAASPTHHPHPAARQPLHFLSSIPFASSLPLPPLLTSHLGLPLLYLLSYQPSLQPHTHTHTGLRVVAAANLVLSPFLSMFLLAYFFMRNAERLYHHPAGLGSRRWSGLAKWRLRELNELPHYLHHRWVGA